MARHDGDLHADSHEPLGLPETLCLFGGNAGESESLREAIACYLAGGEGWREAAKLLGGAFAGDGIGLRSPQKD